jgi:hypothetical protein
MNTTKLPKKRIEINKELHQKGELKKICKKHGEIPSEKIRVDVRGTKICKICDAENAKKYKNKDPVAYREKYRKWFYSDRERVMRYWKNDYEKRKIRQVKAYHRTKIMNPEKHREKELKKNEYHRKASDRLDDYYVRGLLKDCRIQVDKKRTRERLVNDDIPDEIVQLKKIQLKINRALGKRKKK